MFYGTTIRFEWPALENVDCKMLKPRNICLSIVVEVFARLFATRLSCGYRVSLPVVEAQLCPDRVAFADFKNYLESALVAERRL